MSISQPYCTDLTNEELDYNRNRIRGNILPELEKINERAVSHIYDMTMQIRSVYDWYESECLKAYDRYVIEESDGCRIKADDLVAMHESVSGEVIRRMIGSLSHSMKDIENRHISGIYELTGLESGKMIHLPYDLTACREYEYIRLFKNNDISNNNEDRHIINIGAGRKTDCLQIDISEPNVPGVILEGVYLPGEKGIYEKVNMDIRRIEYDGNIENVPKNICTKWFDCDKINGNISLRTPQPDDYIFIDDRRRKKLGRYMIDSKIPRLYRERMLVLASGNEILWIVGSRTSPRYYVGETSRSVLEFSLTF